MGLLQPLGAIPPLAEAQAKLIGDLLVGRYVLPPIEAMRAEMARERRRARRRYVRSERHTMEVDFDRYLDELARERKAGERRARQRMAVRFPATPAR